MALDSNDIWQPTADYIDRAQVTALSKRLGATDIDALYDLSLAEPERYWREVTSFCNIRWSRDYDRYCDLSRGAPFPAWFVGGELNWVDTILDNPEWAARTAIIAEREDGSVREVTYRELKDEVRSLAAGLLRLGLKRGDRIGLLMENGIEASVSLIAVSYIGAIVVPLFSGFGTDAIVARLGSCGAKALLATTGFQRRGRFISTRDTIASVRKELPDLELVVLKRSPEDTAPTDADADYLDWQLVRQSPDSAPPSARMSPNDPFMVIFTSGTTGKPKGAVHVHGGFPIKIAHDSAVHFDVGAGDVFCWPADMGWIAGSLILGSALLRGATLVCYDGAPDYPDWSRMGRLIETYRVTHYGSAPTLIRGLASNEAVSTAPDLSSLRLLITAGESIAAEHFVWFEQAFGRGECPLINYTGGTEVSGCLLSSVVTKPIVPAGFNTRSPGVACDVLDPAGRPLIGAIGELAVLAPFVGMTASFWQDEQRYLETYWSTVPGVWIHGDLAMRTEEGHYFLLGRSDDTIKVAGKRVGPAEVEEILVEIEGVIEAAVIGAEDPVKGQALVAFLTCSGPADDILKLATARIQERLGKPFAPRAVFVVPQLPKTRSSKIMRRVIRSVYSGSPAGDLSSLVNPEAIADIERIVRQGA
ncbi:AMP-binding protein [Bosea sp. SSUT16]|jgi:acetyl-CoA synthetase|uniref:acetate--CoA ligase n=1 Tax=Bosea spartocytisi TaxID=2773451 RepID=A0A927EDQ1_9HYPH|nr:AMP-binding protein [Bosea spartocytisi]MBD3848135.1 AMP-binding protein [Bosea spartocytisi]MCT4473985.1 AMP-binding protein [Bosea spartocytisi]